MILHKLTRSALFSLLILQACNQYGPYQNETGKWLTTMESMKLKGQILKIEEQTDYGEDRVVIHIMYFNEKGMLEKVDRQNGTFASEEKRFFDENDRLIRIVIKDGTGESESTYSYSDDYTNGKWYIRPQQALQEYDYDKNGRVLRLYNLGPKGERMDTTVFSYLNGQTIKEQTYYNGKMTQEATYVYNKRGLLTERSWIAKTQNRIDSKYFYKMDAMDNWTQQIDIHNGDTIVTTRKITYKE